MSLIINSMWWLFFLNPSGKWQNYTKLSSMAHDYRGLVPTLFSRGYYDHPCMKTSICQLVTWDGIQRLATGNLLLGMQEVCCFTIVCLSHSEFQPLHFLGFFCHQNTPKPAKCSLDWTRLGWQGMTDIFTSRPRAIVAPPQPEEGMGSLVYLPPNSRIASKGDLEPNGK